MSEEKKQTKEIGGFATLTKLGGSYATAGVRVFGGKACAVNDAQKKLLKGAENPVKIFSTEKETLDYIERLKPKKKK